ESSKRSVTGVSGNAGLRSGKPSSPPASASRSSLPASTSRITPIAVTSLEIDAIRTGSSALTRRPVALSARPCAWVEMTPSRSNPTRTVATGSAAVATGAASRSRTSRVVRVMRRILARACAACNAGGARSAVARRQLQQPPPAAASAVLEQPDRAVRALFDFADAPLHVEAFRLARGLSVERHPHQLQRRRAADETVALPVREQVAVVDDEAGRRDYRRPGDHRRAEFRPGVVVGDHGAVVVVAVGDDRVAVVRALLDQVELVSAHRAHLVRPQPALAVEG